MFKNNKEKVVCVIMQPFEASKELSKEGFLEGVKKITHKNGSVLILEVVHKSIKKAKLKVYQQE